MEHAFWHQLWESNVIPFHESSANPLLVKHFQQLNLLPGSRVFLPLCGKTLDIAWLLAQGYCVVGAELSELAIQQLFEELAVEVDIAEVGALKRYSAEGLDIFVGDIFALTPDQLGAVDAIYDRGALVALPAEIRARYARHLQSLTGAAPQLLLCFEYDQSEMPGPPFSITHDELVEHYAAAYALDNIERLVVEGGLKGLCEGQETVWLLQPE